MLDIKNKTPYQVALVPGLDVNGCDFATVVIKGTYDIHPGSSTLTIAGDQRPILWADEYYGEPGKSSPKYESDICMLKQGTDVVLIGHAYAAPGATSIDATLQVGAAKKTLRVFGNRYWKRSLLSWQASQPEPFEMLPLVYENAFGGTRVAKAGESAEFEARNPVGKGYLQSKEIDGAPLPNIEDPLKLIDHWKMRPAPAGFGVIARNWLPRMHFAGTYDSRWQNERAPLLPHDFDARYFNAASPELVVAPQLKGGEVVQLTNVSQNPNTSFSLPALVLNARVRMMSTDSDHSAMLDTVVIEPDENRVALTWRATILCARKFLYIDSIRVTVS
ncbi:MAG: DUF2169 domain-containing protein [Gammaproteobacteria bacterium]|nr:DUF2169 domain-containing protein [Gammaproteobacteria bacterium]